MPAAGVVTTERAIGRRWSQPAEQRVRPARAVRLRTLDGAATPPLPYTVRRSTARARRARARRAERRGRRHRCRARARARGRGRRRASCGRGSSAGWPRSTPRARRSPPARARVPYLGAHAAPARRAGPHARAPPRRRAARPAPAPRDRRIERWYRRAARDEVAPRLDAARAALGAGYERAVDPRSAHALGQLLGDRRDRVQLAPAARARGGARLRVWHEACHLVVHGPLAALLGAAGAPPSPATASRASGCGATAPRCTCERSRAREAPARRRRRARRVDHLRRRRRAAARPARSSTRARASSSPAGGGAVAAVAAGAAGRARRCC